MISFPSFAKILIADDVFLYFCNIDLHLWCIFLFSFSNAVTQFLEAIKPLLSTTCFLAYAHEFGYSRKNPNRGCWGHTFLKKIPGIFRFVTFSLEIPDKLKLHPWKFHQIVLHPLEFPRPKAKTHGNSTLFIFWSRLDIPLLFLLTPGVPHSIFSILLEIPCPQRPLPLVCFFLE